MKQPILLSAWLAIIVITFFGCKKDKDEDKAPKTKTELITTGKWKMTAYTINPAQDIDLDGDAETNVFDYLEGCIKDDIITFMTDGRAELNEGATKCDPDDPQTFNDGWSFSDNETKIEYGWRVFNLVELTATTLKISDSYTDTGVTYTETVTYGH